MKRAKHDSAGKRRYSIEAIWWDDPSELSSSDGDTWFGIEELLAMSRKQTRLVLSIGIVVHETEDDLILVGDHDPAREDYDYFGRAMRLVKSQIRRRKRYAWLNRVAPTPRRALDTR